MRIRPGSDRRNHGSPPYPAALTRPRTTPSVACDAPWSPSRPRARPSPRARPGGDLGLLAGATVALRLPAYLASAHLTFDDGVFGASAVAMRAGYQPYREVFSSQGPLFLPLVWVFDLLGFRTANAPRLLSLAAALVLVGGHLRRRPGGDRPGGALFAAGLVSATTTSLWITGPARRRWSGAGLRHRDDGDGPPVAARGDRPAGDVDRSRHRRDRVGEGAPCPGDRPRRPRPAGRPPARADRRRRRDGHRLPPAALAPMGDRERVGAVVRVPPRGRLRSDAGRQPGQGPQHDGRPRRHRAGRGHPGARRSRAAPTGGRPARRARLGDPGRPPPHVGGHHPRRAPRGAPDVAPSRVTARPGPRAAGRPPPPLVAGHRGGRDRAAPLLRRARLARAAP